MKVYIGISSNAYVVALLLYVNAVIVLWLSNN